MNAGKSSSAKGGETTIGQGLIKAKEASELIGISTSCFRYHARKGRITAVRVIKMGKCAVPFYRLEDVEQLRDTLRKDGVPGPGRPRASDYATR